MATALLVTEGTGVRPRPSWLGEKTKTERGDIRVYIRLPSSLRCFASAAEIGPE
jgi:hypothetical protein